MEKHLETFAFSVCTKLTDSVQRKVVHFYRFKAAFNSVLDVSQKRDVEAFPAVHSTYYSIHDVDLLSKGAQLRLHIEVNGSACYHPSCETIIYIAKCRPPFQNRIACSELYQSKIFDLQKLQFWD